MFEVLLVSSLARALLKFVKYCPVCSFLIFLSPIITFWPSRIYETLCVGLNNVSLGVLPLAYSAIIVPSAVLYEVIYITWTLELSLPWTETIALVPK